MGLLSSQNMILVITETLYAWSPGLLAAEIMPGAVFHLDSSRDFHPRGIWNLAGGSCVYEQPLFMGFLSSRSSWVLQLHPLVVLRFLCAGISGPELHWRIPSTAADYSPYLRCRRHPPASAPSMPIHTPPSHLPFPQSLRRNSMYFPVPHLMLLYQG